MNAIEDNDPEGIAAVRAETLPVYDSASLSRNRCSGIDTKAGRAHAQKSLIAAGGGCRSRWRYAGVCLGLIVAPFIASGCCKECIRPDCGSVGQRACVLTERVPSCNDGLTEVPGCVTGDCRGSLGTCADRAAPLAEPSTGWLPDQGSGADLMRGFADLHVHMFSHLAFGGAVMTGAPYHDEGMATALAPDYGTDLDLTNPLSGPPQLVVACPQAVPNCGKNILHGDHVVVGIGFDDPVGAGAVPPDATRSYFGAPVFSGWPTWHSATHQQVYYKWLERAWRGGMRLMTMLAVNNEAACSISKRLRNQDGSAKDCRLSMKEIDDQLRAARTFEMWLDAQPGGGWFRIVKTPREAETVIREGKLAVVLGIEVDSLFNCKQDSSDAACGEAFVDQQVERYYSEFDVRYIYPTHDFDGAFAGTALFIPILELGNLIIEGHFWRTEPCEDSD